jgi:hypothetical protein
MTDPAARKTKGSFSLTADYTDITDGKSEDEKGKVFIFYV